MCDAVRGPVPEKTNALGAALRLRCYAQSLDDLAFGPESWLIQVRCFKIARLGEELGIPLIAVNSSLTMEQLRDSIVAITRRPEPTATDLKLAVAYAVDLDTKLQQKGFRGQR